MKADLAQPSGDGEAETPGPMSSAAQTLLLCSSPRSRTLNGPNVYSVPRSSLDTRSLKTSSDHCKVIAFVDSIKKKKARLILNPTIRSLM